MRRFVLWLTQFTGLRHFVKKFRLHLLGNFFLSLFPVVKTLPATGVKYRARRIESLALSVEMFDQKCLYDFSELPANIQTFADLGCNVGYFTCGLCEHLNHRKIRGIMVDANPNVVTEAKWHIAVNQLSGVQVLCGLLGGDTGSERGKFFLHPSNVCSTAAIPTGPNQLDADWKQIEINHLNLSEYWTTQFKNTPCDLLKIDIEGAEMDFFQRDPDFLRLTKNILVEWHKWRVSLPQMIMFLSVEGFVLHRVFHEDKNIGTALFVRRA